MTIEHWIIVYLYLCGLLLAVGFMRSSYGGRVALSEWILIFGSGLSWPLIIPMIACADLGPIIYSKLKTALNRKGGDHGA